MENSHAELGFQFGAAGFGFGVFNTTLNVINVCKAAYSTWRELGELDSELDLLRAKLLLQQDLLDQWVRDWYGSGHSNKISTTKRRILAQHDGTVRSTLKAVNSLLAKLDSLKEFTSTEVRPSGINRARWLATEIEASTAALREIESLLESLYRLLPLQSPNLEVSRVVISLSGAEGRTAGIESILQTGATSAVATGALVLRKAQKDLQQELEEKVQAMKNSRPADDIVLASNRCLIKEHDESSVGFRSFGTLDGKRAMIEWKRYDPSWQGKKGIELRGRVEKLAQLLKHPKKPQDLLTLQCAGYFDRAGESRYGFAFLLPEPSEDYPVSLKVLVEKPTLSTLPTLEDRYEIAYSLGTSLSILHISEWLHKSIRSHNVLFLKQGGIHVWSQAFLAGFDYSRPDVQDASSERPAESAPFNIYRHPSCQGTPNEKYRREYDYYSLGAVLLEVGLWRPLSKLWRNGTSAVAFRDELIATAEHKLPHCMGLDYTGAVVKCLRGEFELTGSTVQKAFFVDVVEVLGRCVAAVR